MPKFPTEKEIEIMLWAEIKNWSDIIPGEYESMDLMVKNYAFKTHCGFRVASDHIKAIISLHGEATDDS